MTKKSAPVLQNFIAILRTLKLQENHAFQHRHEIRKILTEKTNLSDRSIKYYLNVLLHEGLLSYHYDKDGLHVNVHPLIQEKEMFKT